MKPVPVRPIHRLGLPLGLGLGLVLAVLFLAARLQTAAAQPGTALPAAVPADLHRPLETNTSGPLPSPSDTGASTFAAQAATEALWGIGTPVCSAGTITDLARSTDLAFNDEAGYCENFGYQETWTYNSIQDTALSSIKAVTLNVRIAVSADWENDSIQVRVSNNNGSTWQTVQDIIPSEYPTYTTFPLNVSASFTTPAQLNAARVRLEGLRDPPEDPPYDLYVDEVNLTVSANRPPTASTVTVTGNEDTVINWTPSVTDADGDSLTCQIVSQPGNGTASVNSDCSSGIYTPTGDYNGPDSFTYRAYDGMDYSSAATVNATVASVNDAPVADDVGDATTPEETGVGITLTGSDVDGDGLTFSIASTPGSGSLGPVTQVTTASAVVTYSPDTDFFGIDGFTYTATDGISVSNVAVVTITVTNVNDPPVAVDDQYNTNEEVPLIVAPTGVLSNDIDVDGDPLTATLVGAVTQGELSLSDDGAFVYTPANRLVTYTAVFTYKAGDGTAESNQATVVITVAANNDPPVLDPIGDQTVNEGLIQTVPITATDPEGEAITLSASGLPSFAGFTDNGGGSGTLNLQPGFEDAGVYPGVVITATAGGLSDAEVFTITVINVNRPPVAADDLYTVKENTTLVVAAPGVLGNDADADLGSTLTATLDGGVTDGTLNLNDDGSFTYTPDTNFSGIDSFTYRAYDGTDYSNVATVTVIVKPFCDVTQVTTTTGVVTNSWPSISGGSQRPRIAFVSNKDSDHPEIFLYDATTGSSPQRVTNTGSGATNEQPAISGDGNIIAFASDATLAGNADGNQEIFRYDIAGGHFALATQTDGSVFPGFNLAPSISYPGTRIAFASEYDLDSGNPDLSFEIFRYDWLGGGFGQVSAGGYHSCGVKQADGSVACWGHNFYGQASPPGGSFSQVSAGGYHTCGVRTDGSLACWGANWYGQASPPGGSFSRVSAGGYHSCGVRSDGSVVCWGYNSNGQASSPGGSFSHVSAGVWHTCGLGTNERLTCWGYDGSGQVSGPNTSPDLFAQISASGYHTCGIRSNGTLACWGGNWYGQASPPSGSFQQVGGGWDHTCGVRDDDGTLACWGGNWYDQASPRSGSFSQLNVGWYHACGRRTDSGALECWGRNFEGQTLPPSVPPMADITQLSNSTLANNWSPSLSGDGQYAAFVSDRDGNPEIFVHNGTTTTRVTNTSGVTNQQPSISNNGQYLAFASDRDGNQEIYVYDGISITQVTSTTNQFTSDQPVISGDGKRIAFVSDADLDSDKNSDHNPEIFVAVMGTNAITFGQVTSTTLPVVNSHPSISRLGGAIAFASNADLQPGGQYVSGNPEVFLALCEVDLPPASLEVSKQSGNKTPVTGDLFSYIITITNTGTSEAFGVVLTDTLPPEVEFSVHSRVPECSYQAGTRTVACYFDRLAPGLSETVTIWVRAMADGSPNNAAQALAANPGSAATDIENETLIGTAAELSIVKTVTPTLVTAGEPVTYTLTVRNNRGITATVEITDVLSADMSYVTGLIMPVSANCTWVTTSTITCYPGELARLESISVTFSITPLEEGTLTNQAGATSNPFLADPEPSNHYDSVTISSRSGVFLPIILKNE